MSKFGLVFLAMMFFAAGHNHLAAKDLKGSSKDYKKPSAAEIAKAKKAFLVQMKKGMNVADTKNMAGKRAFTGILTLPKGVPKERLVHFNVIRLDTGHTGNRFQLIAYTDGTDKVKYKVYNIADGTYALEAKCDSDGDNNYTDADAQGEYNDGKAEVFHSEWNTRKSLTIAGKDLKNINFSLAPLPPKPTTAPTAPPTLVPTLAPTVIPTTAPAQEPVADATPVTAPAESQPATPAAP